MKRIIFFLISFCFPMQSLANDENECNLFISEISPTRIAEEDEWIEIVVEKESACNISSLFISNGNQEKPFDEIKETMQTKNITVHEDESGNQTLLTSSINGLLWWDKSPLSLPDNGATISIQEQTNRKDTVTYPKTKSGTIQGNPYTEIWNRTDNPLLPLIPIRYEPNNTVWNHSKGEENPPSTVKLQKGDILIQEISPKNTNTDFIEIQFTLPFSEPINIQGLAIKHNGTLLFVQETPLFVSTNDIFVLETGSHTTDIQKQNTFYTAQTSKKESLSSGSGTVEIIHMYGTSAEERIDTVCWKKQTLSQSETKRVIQYREAFLWNGECIDIQDMIPNESIARKEKNSPPNQASNFFRHFNGSKGTKNKSQNTPPKAQITLQGGRKIYTKSLNLTAENSFDPDGDHDLHTYQWEINGKSCPNDITDTWRWSDYCEIESKRSNPKTIYFDAEGLYTIKLTLWDHSGEKDTLEIPIEVTTQIIQKTTRGGGAPHIFEQSIQKWTQSQMTKKNIDDVYEKPFFEDFLNALSPEKIQILKTMPPSQIIIPTPPKPKLFKRDALTQEEKNRLRKNTGLIFLWHMQKPEF